jgi:dipeptidyl aminopeptidase/acylaminoacyl peptidase
MGLGEADQPEHYPYAQAGMVVVAFELDGPVDDLETASNAEIRAAYDRFVAAGAGIVNARNAFLYASTQIPAVDPNRIYIAGHSSAATLALLSAAHEPRLAGAIAYAPCTDLLGRYGIAAYQLAMVLPDCRSFLAAGSPVNHVARIRSPVFLFHAEDDSNVPIDESRRFADKLRAAGGKLAFRTVPSGDHYDSMIDQGVPQAIEWLRQGGKNDE